MLYSSSPDNTDEEDHYSIGLRNDVFHDGTWPRTLFARLYIVRTFPYYHDKFDTELLFLSLVPNYWHRPDFFIKYTSGSLSFGALRNYTYTACLMC